jgi:hypothetical protein
MSHVCVLANFYSTVMSINFTNACHSHDFSNLSLYYTYLMSSKCLFTPQIVMIDFNVSGTSFHTSVNTVSS